MWCSVYSPSCCRGYIFLLFPRASGAWPVDIGDHRRPAVIVILYPRQAPGAGVRSVCSLRENIWPFVDWFLVPGLATHPRWH